MLPGFRFLFAATFLTMSILVFGLGAAALLRAAHEQFATNPSWHAAPEATFAQQVEPARPVLALLRVVTPATEQKTSADLPAADVPTMTVPAEQAAPVQPPAEIATIAALKPEPPAAAKPDMAVPENPAPTAAAAAPGDAPASEAPQQQPAALASSDKAQIASTDQAAPAPISPPAIPAVPAAANVDAAASLPANAPAPPETDAISAKIAALDSPSVTVKPDPSVVKQQLRARRAAHRRRMAARTARMARLAAQQLMQQQAADPFGLRFSQPAALAPVHSR